MKLRLLGLVGVAAIITVGVSWSVAGAQSFRSGNTTTIEPKEVVDSTLWVSGRTIDIAGQVNGDVFCAGMNVTVSGTVRGDLLCAAQTIVISGTVTGDVRSAAQTVTVNGTVIHNLSAAAQSFNQSTKGSVKGDLSVGANDIAVNGAVGRDAVLGAQTITLGGPIGRNVKATVNDMRLNRGAKINGNLDYTSQNDVKIASGATVAGKTTKSTPKEDTAAKKPAAVAGFSFGFALYVLAAGLLTALVLILLLPQAIHAVTDQAVRSPWKSLLVGFLAAIAMPVLIIVLMVTVVGIPLALLLLVAWLLVQGLAWIMSAYYLGRLLLKNQRNAVLVMLLGALLLIVLCLIPFIGVVAFAAAMLFGIGMILLELNNRRPKHTYRLSAPNR